MGIWLKERLADAIKMKSQFKAGSPQWSHYLGRVEALLDVLEEIGEFEKGWLNRTTFFMKFREETLKENK